MGGIGSFIRKYRRGRWVMIGQGIGGIGALIRRSPNGGWEILGQEMVECGSFVRRKRSWGWEDAEWMYGAVGENSIDFLKKLYRLFRKTL